MTVLDLITRSMRLLNAINVGDVPTADEQADGLTALNSMVDAWAAERLMIFAASRNVYDIVEGQGVYQIGPEGPDWIGPRPQFIESAGLLLLNSDPTQVYERPLKIIRTMQEWARVRMKGLQSTLPTKIFYDAWFSNANSATAPVGSGNVALWPVPTQANQVALYSACAVEQFSSVTQTLALPPGYARALASNLATEMATEFDRDPSDSVLTIAQESKAVIKRANLPQAIGRLRLDPALQAQGGHFDWLIGETR